MSARPIYVETRAARRSIRGRLFRKYLLLILLPVTIALLASNAISVYFSYQEIESGLASLQHEKALALASSIEQYIRQIEQQLTYAALPQLDASDVAVRYGEFRNLLRQVPAVTDIVQLNSAGNEQIAVSRSGLENFDSGKVRSEELAFRYAECGQPWVGPVDFRKKTEPHMTIAIRSCGDKEPVTGPVTVAVVNLKFILELVSRIKIGDKGMAYVVDGNGFLIADPDGSLREIDMSDLPHVKAAIGNQNLNQPAMVSRNLARTMVLTSFAPIEPLHWYVFVEQPVSEVYEKLNAPILRTGLLLLAGLVISALGALALAQRISVGELDQKIDEISRPTG
jgi:Cache domain